MYLFSRQARLTGPSAMEWATEIQGHVKKVIGNDVQLWTTVYSPGFGTVSWTSWWADLTSLEAAMDRLQADAKFNDLAAKGQDLVEGPVDDVLIQTIHGEPDPNRPVKYAAGVQAVCAGGNIARAMTVGVEIAEKVEAITSVPTIFGRTMTGPYGGAGWLNGYEDLAHFETAQDKLAVDPGWLSYIDSTQGCFVENPTLTQQTIYRRMA